MLATVAAEIHKSIEQGLRDAASTDWASTQVEEAVCLLDQAREAQEALRDHLTQLTPGKDTLASVLQKLKDRAHQLELQAVLASLRRTLAMHDSELLAPFATPRPPCMNLGAILDEVTALHDATHQRKQVLTEVNDGLMDLMLKLLDALEAVATRGAVSVTHRLHDLRQCVQHPNTALVPAPQDLPDAWEQLCETLNKLRLFVLNEVVQLAHPQAERADDHQAGFASLMQHAKTLEQQLQDVADWQATTLSVLTSCIGLVDGLAKNAGDGLDVVRELDQMDGQIQGINAALQLELSETVHCQLEQRVEQLKQKRDLLGQRLSSQAHVQHVAQHAKLAMLLKQHFPELLVLLRSEPAASLL
ncbi:uncharacterized protein MONBRDRAFT_11986 [Monosiga brevicollis MX1]|uniref:Uncharacterized protein n=1 Tax=Monosiga brevicollis TaxID=81824 RepID=A9VAV9_MONBE|nr:uncharacterized protein MONBRDRAFT_11986 [Monosiga brevicollis MX1]EDQ85284.1 predicted protein [Monosiga brevicollis MX1]|eukprot:XP_001749905.1 hypothetical protein [Monosiga brevicollis MX1]